jgi:hypothetical protein
MQDATIFIYSTEQLVEGATPIPLARLQGVSPPPAHLTMSQVQHCSHISLQHPLLYCPHTRMPSYCLMCKLERNYSGVLKLSNTTANAINDNNEH